MKMQTSGDRRRENAKSYSVVIVREGGRSSIPETAVIEPRSRSLLDTPHARGMTTVVFRVSAVLDKRDPMAPSRPPHPAPPPAPHQHRHQHDHKPDRDRSAHEPPA